MANFSELFDKDTLETMFPADRADTFFEALFGDASEGAYDISLAFSGEEADQLVFEFRLVQRPGSCLRCSLTYGLPQVFSRHPVINVKGVVASVAEKLGKSEDRLSWELKPTREVSSDVHAVPLVITMN